MLRKVGQLKLSILILGDLVALLVAWLLAYYMRFHLEIIPLIRGFAPLGDYLILFPFVVIFWLAATRLSGLYRLSAGLSRRGELSGLTRSAAIAFLLLLALTFFYREQSYSRVLMAYFLVLSIILLVVFRSLSWHVLARLRQRGFEVRRVLIAGAGPLAESLAERLSRHADLGFEVVGMLSEGGHGGEGKGARFPVVGSLKEAKSLIARGGVNDLFIALPLEAHDEMDELLKSVADETVDIRVVPDFTEYMHLNPGIENFDGLPVVNLSESPLFGWNRLIKRGADLIFATFSIIILSPLMALIALLVKLTSPGPVLYKQERMGLDGVRFQMYKFRSMRADAEADTGAVWAKPGDERRTKLGALLRKTSLDELPQLFNVLKGEMSIVGPRPERPVFVENFRRSVPGYMLRHKMKSGITGWAQVNGWRGNTSLEKRVEFDLYYIEHWSLRFDLKIMWLTLWRGLVSKHAY
ncbi:MAG: undecaprenyl-phosphate glucose phosphotransferase [Nitrospinota bacterium]